MAILVTDFEYFNGNWYFAIYGDDFQPHVYKMSSDLIQTIDLGVIHPDAWNYWGLKIYNGSIYAHASRLYSEDPATLVQITPDGTFVAIAHPNFTFPSFKNRQFDYITEINNELWCIHHEDTRIQVFNGNSLTWRTEGELYYGDAAGTLGGFFSNGTDIYLKAVDSERGINGFFKYNPSYVFNGTYGDTLKWEFVKEYDPTSTIIGSLNYTFNYDSKLFISGTTKLAEFDFINLEYKNIETIPNAQFFVFNNLLHCRSSDRKLYKYENDTWAETQFALLPLSTGKVVNVDNKLYVVNDTTCLTLNCI